MPKYDYDEDGDLILSDDPVAIAQRAKTARIKAMKEAEKNMAERRKRLEKKTENIKKYVKSVMEENQITKIETVNFDLTIKKNPPKAVIEDEEMIPESFIEQHMTEKINVKKIKDELKKGQNVQGARLIQETRLDIK